MFRSEYPDVTASNGPNKVTPNEVGTDDLEKNGCNFWGGHDFL